MRFRKPATIHLTEERTGVSVSDCRTQDGITIGLIDGMIAICRILRGRDFSSPDVKEALKDLVSDGDLEFIMNQQTIYSCDNCDKDMTVNELIRGVHTSFCDECDKSFR